jgi:hypothetical protein
MSQGGGLGDGGAVVVAVQIARVPAGMLFKRPEAYCLRRDAHEQAFVQVKTLKTLNPKP